jgi:UDP-2,3-diacylglucosamine hydrolase
MPAKIDLPTSTFDIPAGKSLFIASDFHLGSPNYQESLAREKRVVRWLETVVLPEASDLVLLGDTFDFWFEYGHAIPKGFLRLQGALARLADAGVRIHLFTGNHDMWMFGYFEKELGARIYRDPITIQIAKKKILLAHGDGLGPGDRLYKVFRFFFHSKICQWLFKWIHPDVGLLIANSWSRSSRKSHSAGDADFKGDKEHIWQWARQVQAAQPHDYYIMGHRHLHMRLPVGEASTYINLGDWFEHGRYIRIDEIGEVCILDE